MSDRTDELRNEPPSKHSAASSRWVIVIPLRPSTLRNIIEQRPQRDIFTGRPRRRFFAADRELKKARVFAAPQPEFCLSFAGQYKPASKYQASLRADFDRSSISSRYLWGHAHDSFPGAKTSRNAEFQGPVRTCPRTADCRRRLFRSGHGLSGDNSGLAG